jgi:hypothetical protein
MSKNMVDGVDFTADDLCIWVLHLPGACGDLIGAIINNHYINSGCNYYGINDNGQVIFLPTDYKTCTRNGYDNVTDYNDKFFYGIADSLGARNLNYSLLDNVIFTHHIYLYNDVLSIINKFPKGKFIRIVYETQDEKDIIDIMAAIKNSAHEPSIVPNEPTIVPNEVNAVLDQRLLDIRFSDLFEEEKFEKVYDNIVEFLGLPSKLIRYDFIEFYISKQHKSVQQALQRLHS